MSFLGDLSGAGKGFIQNLPYVGGFFGGDPTQNVQFQMPGESEELQKSRGNVVRQAQASEQDLIDRQLAGTNPNAVANLGQDLERSNVGLGGYNPAIGEALTRRAQKTYDTNFNNMKRRIELGAGNERFKRLQAPIDPLMAQNQLAREIAMKQAEAESAKYAARANAIKDIFGTGGAIVGGALGGGTGAQIGSQAGGPRVGSVEYY